MDDYRRSQVPAFGSWDYADGLPFTQCFETARQQVRYGCYPVDRDLYVAGDLYQNDVVTPAVIVVPRRRTKGRQAHGKKHHQQEWGYDSYTTKEPPSPIYSPPPPPSPPPRRRPTPKAVDEDLYKIPPELLHSRPKRKRRLGFFSSCLLPVCA